MRFLTRYRLIGSRAGRCIQRLGMLAPFAAILALAVVQPLQAQNAIVSHVLAAAGLPEKEVLFDREQILEDLEFTRALLQRHQPNFGLHTSEEEINATFDAVAENLPEKATVREVLRRLLPAVASVRDGHTCITFGPDQLTNQMLRMQAPSLDFVALEDKLYIEQSASGATAGDEVLEINDKPVAQWIKEANEYFCLDKSSDITAFDPTGDTLPYYLWLVAPAADDFVYDLKRPDGRDKRLRIRGQSPIHQYSRPMQRNRPRFEFSVHNGVAVLAVNTFLGDKQQFEDFFDEVFDELNRQDVKDLVIDLRENTGGQIGNASLLLAYLLNRKHHFPRYIHVTGEKISRKAKLFVPGRSKSQMDTLRKDSNRLQLRYRNYPTRYEISPRGTAVETQSVSWGKRHFKGQLHVLISGQTYSAASLFVGELRKNRPSAIFYGQRTGGLDNRGCMRNPVDFVLPNSGLLLSVPVMCHIQDLNAEAKHFAPDVEDNQTVEDFFAKRDTVLEDVVDMIKANTAPDTQASASYLPPLPLPKPAPFLAVKP